LLCNVVPRGGWPARGSKIPARFAGVWPGKGGGGLKAHLGVDLHRIWGVGLCQRAGSTAAASGRRCAPVSGEGRLERSAAVAGLGSREAREGGGKFTWLAVGRELELTAAGLEGTGGSSVGRGGGGSARRGNGAAAPL
jgi:hypothetical protein